MTTKHKHYDLIVAWAGGAEIEVEIQQGLWVGCKFNSPTWTNNVNYRIKPKPKVKKSRWVIEGGTTFGMFVSTKHYPDSSSLEKENPGLRAVMHIPETMIEVEE